MSNGVTPVYSLRELVIYFLRLGTLGFGGPVALVGYMHRDLVEHRRWISDEDYKEGLALAQLAPGPLAAQLAIYLGYVHYGILGATLVGIAFVLPSFLMVVALGWAYVHFEGLPGMQAVFYGVGAAVIGIIAISTHKLANKSLGQDWLLWGIFGVSAGLTVWTEDENMWLFLGAGTLVWLVKAPPRTRFLTTKAVAAPAFGLLAQVSTTSLPVNLTSLALFFAKAGAFVFGSGLAIVPFLYSGVVKEYGWLNEQQFLDAVAVAMITPGPVVITVGFIGYLVEGFPGACVAALGTFLPCYLLTVLPAPYFRRYGKLPALKAFVEGVTAAAVGAIAGAVVILGLRSLTDGFAIGLALLSGLLLWRFKKLPEPYLILGAAVLGVLIKAFQP
ncbi:chromate transporter [Spirosoma soli]|uniref:Chromate transporter n=1 Tax=Spirosoma soli TaxID=1770529 RepID=A0ABW5M7B1_9BACT